MSSSHEHSHTGTSGHTHSHGAPADMSKEEVLALLSYMIDHNRHHEEELHELSHNLDDKAGALVHEALQFFRSGNELLVQALSESQHN